MATLKRIPGKPNVLFKAKTPEPSAVGTCLTPRKYFKRLAIKANPPLNVVIHRAHYITTWRFILRPFPRRFGFLVVLGVLGVPSDF